MKYEKLTLFLFSLFLDTTPVHVLARDLEIVVHAPVLVQDHALVLAQEHVHVLDALVLDPMDDHAITLNVLDHVLVAVLVLILDPNQDRVHVQELNQEMIKLVNHQDPNHQDQVEYNKNL